MKYKSIIVTGRGGPEVLQVIENDLRAPLPGEVRIRILATPVCQDDIAVRTGRRPFLAKIPFVPGYSILGVVDALGEGVTDAAEGERVAALTNFGGYAEYIYLGEEQLVHVPPTLDPAEAVVLILNYVVAYQVMHQSVKVKPDDKVLIVGASGGVGTAFLQLGKLADLKMYGLASRGKHSALTEMGAIPIDYHTQDFVDVIRAAEPDGIDYVFNGMGEEYFERGLAVLQRGGALVHYGGPQSFLRFLLLMAKFILFNLLPNGKTIRGYGTHRGNMHLFKEDWAKLFKLLEEGRIKPIIAKKYPILEAARANELLESGQVTGNIVLLAPELL
ncbi:MAG: medium chain dehydrogenase/reductase family protein [Anaerolineaceae bacterium]|nr:medium chain dehydrogenase/reductase family protein [Anaerolineaceae bacterium]